VEPDADAANYRFMAQQDPAGKGSMCHDLEAGRRLEIDPLCGYVSRMGRVHGVATPLNDYLYDTLKLEDLQAARRSTEGTT
jgi:ketopantoate reductase